VHFLGKGEIDTPPLASPFHNGVIPPLGHHKKYKVSMTDPMTGTEGESDGHQKDKNLAGQQAVYNLFQKDLGCNCHEKQGVKADDCMISIKGCFFWNTIQDLQKGTTNATGWKFFVQVHSPKVSPVFNSTAANSTTLQIEHAVGKIMDDMAHFDHCFRKHNGTELLRRHADMIIAA
jgi:hypothetical protein